MLQSYFHFRRTVTVVTRTAIRSSSADSLTAKLDGVALSVVSWNAYRASFGSVYDIATAMEGVGGNVTTIRLQEARF